MIELNWIEKKWYEYDEKTCTWKIKSDAPKEVKEAYEENKKIREKMQKVFFGNFGKDKKSRKG